MIIPHPTAGQAPVTAGHALEDDSRELMQDLRRALVEACAAAGADPLRPRHAARVLGVDKTLMWRISRIVHEPDVFQAVSHVPRRGGVGILCRALARARVPAAVVERVRALLGAFDALAARHGGDRATFELLAAGFSPAERNLQSLEQGRRLAFRGNSAVWGVQARLQLATCILLPARSRIDLVRLSGFVDLLRLRARVSWPLSRRTFFDELHDGPQLPPAEPLDDGAGAGRGALIREFSSASLPELQAEAEDGGERCILPAGVPGRTGRLTAVFGRRYRGNRAIRAAGSGRARRLTANLSTPVERLQFDLLVHQDLAGNRVPGVALFGALDGRSGAPTPPFAEAVIDLGRGITGSAAPEMPRYPALLEWAFQRLGADPAEFRSFRFAMAYPPIPAKAVLDATPPAAENGHRRARPDGDT